MNQPATPRERVLLTLLGLSDPTGRILAFSKTEALDFAHVPAAEFERELQALAVTGLIEELPREGRATRRFQIRDIARRPAGLAYVDGRRDIVSSINARRAELEPGRAREDEPPLAPRVVRVDFITGEGRPRYAVTAQVRGIGTLRGWIYYPEFETKAAFISSPSRKVGDAFQETIDALPAFRQAMLCEVQEILNAQTRTA